MAEHATTTPSGWQIVFEDGLPDKVGKSKRRTYTVDGERYPSVTTALGVIEKPGLLYAAEKLTVSACIELARDGELPLYVDAALSRMRARELTFRAIWNQKAERGTTTHEDLLLLATGEPLRELALYPPEVRGFLKGVAAWFADVRPEVVDSELFVASKAHGFAGRLDLRCVIDGRVTLVDLKTGPIQRNKDGTVKPPYTEAIAQVGAYELAARECGYGSTDVQAILRVDEDGERDFYVTVAEPRVFLAALELYRALRGLRAPSSQLELA